METKVISSYLKSFLTPQQLKCITWTFRHFNVVSVKDGEFTLLNFDDLVNRFGLACASSMCFLVAEANSTKVDFDITYFANVQVKFYPNYGKFRVLSEVL